MKLRSTLEPSPAYKVGKSSALATAYQKGHTGFLPSATDRADWGHDWAAFMAGWHAGRREYSKR